MRYRTEKILKENFEKKTLKEKNPTFQRSVTAAWGLNVKPPASRTRAWRPRLPVKLVKQKHWLIDAIDHQRCSDRLRVVS